MTAIRRAVAALSLSAIGLLGIADFEGFREQAYVPVEGDVLTIGFGSTSGVREGDTISVTDALHRLDADTKAAQDAVRRCVKVPLTQSEFDAYTSLAFNIGGARFCSSTLVKKANARDYAGACSELKRWVYCGGQRLAGLERRREKEYQMCISEH